jgi:probable rRNA maturation factor
MAINFHYIDIPKFKWKLNSIKKWLQSIASEENFKIKDLNYVFCTDEYLLDINIQHLNHDTYTDIITFDLSSDTSLPIIDAEIYISVDRVRENASKFDKTLPNELSRVLTHGILHLCGYKDKSPSEQKIMREKEDYYIQTSPFLE